MKPSFWSGRRVFVTGHTGFKGSWLTLWLTRLGARVTGYALPPDSQPNLFDDCRIAEKITSITGDVRDLPSLCTAVVAAQPEVVFHLAAQSLVRASYEDPVGTYSTNVMGTVNVLESIRSSADVRVGVIVTSDKCYAQSGAAHAFVEEDPLGGRDPYSSSKGCAELVTTAYRKSFFGTPGAARIFSARAGNVIGGGDWAVDRLVPDLVRAFNGHRAAVIRNPDSIRPWQFVLDALHGYLLLAEAGFGNSSLPDEWNFGPAADDFRAVRWIADSMTARWGSDASWRHVPRESVHEEETLTLDSSKARLLLEWQPKLDSVEAIDWTVDSYRGGASLAMEQIDRFTELVRS